MEELTGLTGFDGLLVLAYCFALVLLAEPVWNRPARGLPSVLGVACGAALLAFLLVNYRAETRYVIAVMGDRAGAIAFAVGGLFLALAVRELVLGRARGLAVPALERLALSRRNALTAATAGILAGAVAVGVVGLLWAEDRLESGHAASRDTAVDATGQITVHPGADVAVRSRHTLPGHPVDLVLRGPRDGYISFAEGEIGHFTLPTAGGSLAVEPVVTGLDYPRGLAVVGDMLVVAELGSLPCREPFPVCKGEHVPGMDIIEGEREILRVSRARILAFDIREDGSLGTPRTLLADLPVANTDHAVNGITLSPDGRLYISIGGLDRLWETPDVGSELGRPNADLLGTVVTLDPAGGRPEIFARGLRNVYDLTFDAEGRLYGVDNDGSAQSGLRREELLQIRKGGDYGYPYDGTFAPYAVPRDPPLWVIDSVGSAGIEWIPGSEESLRLLLGACGRLSSIVLHDEEGSVGVREADAYLLDIPGCATAVERGPDGTVLMTVWGIGVPPELDVLAPSSDLG